MVKTKSRVPTNGVHSPQVQSPIGSQVSKLEIVTFKIIGTSPLMQNNPELFVGKGDSEGIAKGKKKYDDQEETVRRLYVTEDGDYYHPTEAFIKSAILAVSGMKFGKRSAKAMIRGAVFVAEPQSIILDGDGKPAKHCDMDKRPVVVAKARVMRCRPVWPLPWSMDIALEIDVAWLSRDQFLEALLIAGPHVGIGDNRPEKGGPNGRFRAE